MPWAETEAGQRDVNIPVSPPLPLVFLGPLALALFSAVVPSLPISAFRREDTQAGPSFQASGLASSSPNRWQYLLVRSTHTNLGISERNSYDSVLPLGEIIHIVAGDFRGSDVMFFVIP